MRKHVAAQNGHEPPPVVEYSYDKELRRLQVELVKLGGKKPGMRYPRLLNSSGDAPEQYPERDD